MWLDKNKIKEYRESHRDKHKEYMKEYNNTNRKRLLEDKKDYHIENREKILENHRSYYQRNKEILSIKQKEYRIKNRDKIKKYYEDNKIILKDRRVISDRKKKYGLSEDDYGKMVARCGGKCEICGKKMILRVGEKHTKDDACIDHNHATEKVRGLVCSACNSLLGFSYDNKETLKNAIIYLEKYEN